MKFILNITLLFCSFNLLSQNQIRGVITSSTTGLPIENVDIFDKEVGYLTSTDNAGCCYIETNKEQLHLILFSDSYEVAELILQSDTTYFLFKLKPLAFELNAVEVKSRKAKLFSLERMKDVEGTSIYAGKKTEVVLVNQSIANLSSNNARQIYSQVAGLNIYQNDDAGLQLHIGGRGLDPSRTANFNTRQNGYDISADVLGYPESYYTPPAESLEKVQIIRGAASLQYGTQFGGLLNFIIKQPVSKGYEFIYRNTFGTNNLHTTFTSVSERKGALSYYAFYNLKRGDGFRENSAFESNNAYAHISYDVNENSEVSAEITYLSYLAQQAGGLTDYMFDTNPFQSNRDRNWFHVDWLVYNLKWTSSLSKNTNFSFQYFGLQAQRDALGFRSNRVDQIDPDGERDLIQGKFRNSGIETRLLHHYKLGRQPSVFLIGSKYYEAENSSQQGPGSAGKDALFEFQLEDFPFYNNQSQYTYPNQNISLFSENIFYLSEQTSITPGVRFEYINTKSDGFYRQINLDAAGNPIRDTIIADNNVNERAFALFGLGLSHKPNSLLEMYANTSQNYRSVTFLDISIVNPAYTINPNIQDENGLSFDLGIRGNANNFVSYDVNIFGLLYNNRIGFIQKVYADGNVKSERGNVGDALIFGLESVLDVNLKKLLSLSDQYVLNYVLNSSFIESKYIRSEEAGIIGNDVELIPNWNIKTSCSFGHKDLMMNLQYTYLSSQFTDATNAIESNLSGVIGEIPSYSVLDFSCQYYFTKFKLEAGVNNLLDTHYFTRRATGYPGPGIIPSPNRNLYLTIGLTI